MEAVATSSFDNDNEWRLKKFSKMLIKVRVKLSAVSAFLRLKKRGHTLSCLDISSCGLSGTLSSSLCHTVSDNWNLTNLNLSDNPKLLIRSKYCKEFRKALQNGRIVSIKLNNCGMTDNGLMEIAKGILEAKSLNDCQMSDNLIGPTGANWISTFSKDYNVISLGLLTNSYHKKAPFRRRGSDIGSINRQEESLLGDLCDDSSQSSAEEAIASYSYGSDDERLSIISRVDLL